MMEFPLCLNPWKVHYVKPDYWLIVRDGTFLLDITFSRYIELSQIQIPRVILC